MVGSKLVKDKTANHNSLSIFFNYHGFLEIYESDNGKELVVKPLINQIIL